MASFLEHALRLIDPFHFLPRVTVPSAAVDDEQTEAWSRELYERDLDLDRKERGVGESLR